MRASWISSISLGAMVATGVLASASAQSVPQAQIPTLQPCNRTSIQGGGTVKLDSRGGSFTVKISVNCTTAYPDGTVSLDLNLSDSFKGQVTGTQLDQVTSAGRDGPVAWVSGRCRAGDVVGCRFWLMVADNPKDKLGDIAGFLVLDGTGKRVAHGAGQLDEGDINITPSGF